MSTQPLTPQERAVMNALPSGRPKRYLHVYALAAVGLFFLGTAAYKVLTGSSSTSPRVADRPGPNASVEEPSPATLRELIHKQSMSGAAPKPEAGREDRLSQVPPQPQLQPQPPGASPAITPLTLSREAVPASLPAAAPLSSELDGKLAQASYMTAKTEVYIQAATPDLGRHAERSFTTDNDSGLSSRQLRGEGSPVPGAIDAISRALDPRELGKLMPGAKTSLDERLAMRSKEQESFATAARPVRGPVVASPAPNQPVVVEGTAIPAVLVRAIGSQLPGQVEARVTADVYDSLGRGWVLIPKGSRITGTYNSHVGIGQERLQAVFTRIVFPSGASIALEGSSAADRAGNSGIPGDVNHNYLRMLGSALAVGMLTYAVERRAARDAAQPGNPTVAVYGGAASAPGTVAAQTFANVTNPLLERHLSVGPTIAVPAGTRINVHVARDLAIDPRRVL